MMKKRFAIALLLSIALSNLSGAEVVGSLPTKNANTNPPAVALLSQTQIAQDAYAAGFRGFGLVISIAVCAAESANRADAITQITDQNGTSDNLGLWQINDFLHTDGIGASTSSTNERFHAESLYDTSQFSVASVANANAAAAYIVSTMGTNWWPWSSFQNFSGPNSAFAKLSAANNTIRSKAAALDSGVIIGIGDSVVVTADNTAVRSNPGAEPPLALVNSGKTGTIIGGPSAATPIDGQSYPYIWWQIQWGDATPTGWVAEDFLKRTSAPTGAASDLALQSISVTHGTYAPGATITIGNLVKNIGGTTSHFYTITFYASTDATITTGDTVIGSSDRSGLAPGATDPETSTNGVLPNNLPPGNYYIGAILTIAPDANANNNINLDPVPITVSSSPGNQNVTVSNVFPDPASGQPGSSSTFHADVNSPIAQNVLLGASIVLSGTNSTYRDPANDTPVTLTIGQNQYQRTFTLPANLPPGTYDVTFEVWADANSNSHVDPAIDVILGTSTATGALTVLPALGTIMTTITPQGAIDAGAQWRGIGSKTPG